MANATSILPGIAIIIISISTFCIASLYADQRTPARLLVSADMAEANALMDFKRAITSDPLGRLASWAIDDALIANSSAEGPIYPCAHPTWTGLLCDSQKRHVIAIDLASSNLTGSISPSIARLPALSSLNLSDNSLYGGIPSSLMSRPHTALQHLNLSANALNESLPDSFGNLSALLTLDLGSNFLAGNIPRSFGECKSLQGLYLMETGMTGSIPSELWQLPALIELQIKGDSALAATLPKNFASCPTLRALELSSVTARGSPFPSHLSNCKQMEYLVLDVVGLEGSIAAEFWQLPALEYLVVQDSEVADAIDNAGVTGDGARQFNLHGSLPTSFRSCPTLIFLAVDGVNLTGSIPSSLGQCSALEFIDLSHGSLQGEIPKTLGNLSNLEILFLQSQMLTGTLPKELFAASAVIAIKVGDNPELRGPIPGEVGALKQLQHLSLFTTSLSGPVPEELCNCTQLQWLDVGWPRYSLGMEKMPDCLPKLVNLQTIGWQYNPINGQLPIRLLSNLTQLQYLDLSFASLKGAIPPELGNLSSLQTLGLRQNDLTGPIPSELSRAPLQKLDLSINKLNGSIPEAFIMGLVNGSSITELYLSLNNLHGVIPSSIGQLQTLQLLYMDQNKFQGKIPPTLGNASSLQDLLLQSNQLEGPIPSSLARLTSLRQNLLLADNRLHGRIPPELGALTNLKVLDLSNNQFSGHVPTTAFENCTNLETLRLSQNHLVGKLEHLDFSKMPNLKTFTIQQNNMQGALPENLTSSKNLVLLDFQRNNLSGIIPAAPYGVADISGLMNLRVLVMSHNQFTGEIPDWVWKLPMLQVLDLSNNSFHGKMPSTVTHLSYFKQAQTSEQTTLYEEVPQEIKGSFQLLTYILNTRISFDVSSNDLEGEIAESFGALVGLLDLDLSYNRIGGAIPQSLGNLVKLEELDLSHNQLSHSIPKAIAELGGLSVMDLSYNHLQGAIPTIDNFQTRFNYTSFQGNVGLCGPPLPQPCNSSETHRASPTSVESGQSFWNMLTGFMSPWAFCIAYPIGLVAAFYFVSHFDLYLCSSLRVRRRRHQAPF